MLAPAYDGWNSRQVIAGYLDAQEAVELEQGAFSCGPTFLRGQVAFDLGMCLFASGEQEASAVMVLCVYGLRDEQSGRHLLADAA